MFRSSLALAALLALPAPPCPPPQDLGRLPDSPLLEQADGKYQALFELRDDALISKHLRDAEAGELGVLCWQRITTLFPLSFRKLLIEFNVHGERSLAGSFSGDGSNDLERRGYRVSVVRYLLDATEDLDETDRPVTPRRGTLDWTLVHELGHYICLRTNAIELFSQEFDGDDKPQPLRREDPDDYPENGAPRLDGDFVTSYAERAGGDEEVVESFTTFLMVAELPEGDSLAARKVRFFETMPGYPELRDHVQSIGWGEE